MPASRVLPIRPPISGAPSARRAPARASANCCKNAAGHVLDAGRRTDNQTHAMASGKANVVDVVTAVAETEVAVETMVAVRDRVISAYEEIMRMPI